MEKCRFNVLILDLSGKAESLFPAMLLVDL